MSSPSENTNPLKDRRRWWVALLMLFPTGAGYIYVGRPWRFVVFTAFILLCLATLFYTSVWGEPDVFPVIFALVIIAAVGFAVDIVVIAIKQNSHDLRWPQRRIWYVACLALWAALLFATGAFGA